MTSSLERRLVIDGYDVSTAICLLGPSNYTEAYESQGCFEYICNVICSIWITFVRVLNLIFGDCNWYNNDVAEILVRQFYYYRDDYDDEDAELITELFNKLETRAYNPCCCDSGYESYADRLRPLVERNIRPITPDPESAAHITSQSRPPLVSSYSQPSTTTTSQYHSVTSNSYSQPAPAQTSYTQGYSSTNQPIYSGRPAPQGASSSSSQDLPVIGGSQTSTTVPLPQHPIVSNRPQYDVLRDPLFNRGETGNITLLENLMRAVDDPDFRSIRNHFSVIADNLRMHQHVLFESDATPEECSLMYRNLCDVYAERKYKYPEGETEASDSEPDAPRILPSQIPIECPKDNIYATAKDPYELFRLALRKACTELNVSSTDLNDPSNLNRQNAYRLAVYLLISQADVCTEACDGPYVKFNGYLTAKYQNPILIYAPDKKGEFEATVIYDRDIFSSTTIGCDPEGARRLIKTFEEISLLDLFRIYLLDAESSSDDDDITTEMKLLKELIDTMAGQVQSRYGPTIDRMVAGDLSGIPDPQLPDLDDCSYTAYIESAKTPTECIRRSMLWAAHQYADQHEIHEDDITWGEAHDHAKELIGLRAVFEIIKHAQPVDDFHLQLKRDITLEFGKFYAYEPMPEKPNRLAANERYISNEFGGVGNMEDRCTDPIKAKHLMNELSTTEMQFFLRYFTAYRRVELLRLKGITDTTTLNMHVTAQNELERMNPARRDIIRELSIALGDISSYILDKYFLRFSPDIQNNVQYSDDPPLVAVSAAPQLFVGPLTTQAVQLHYFPELVITRRNNPYNYNEITQERTAITREQITIKDRPQRTVGTSIKVTQENAARNPSTYLEEQNVTISNPAQCGNCMYGALALEIFGEAARDHIDSYARVLRGAAANYMEAHPELFLHLMSQERDTSYNTKETEQAFMARMGPTLQLRLTEYCRKVRDTLEWGTAAEMEAIAAVIGVPIHVFHFSRAFRVGTEGIEEGVIQPNGFAGVNFSGAPIRLMFTGNHYKPIRLRTVSRWS